MQIAIVSIQRKIKFNVKPCDFAPTHFNLVPSFPGYEIAELFDFRLFLVKLKKQQQQQQPHYKRITFPMHPVFHPITLCYIRSAVVLRGLPAYSFSLFAILALSAITISDSILAIDVTLDRQNVHLLCILISTHLLHFMTAEIASILRQCFDLVNYSLSSVGGLHASSSLD